MAEEDKAQEKTEQPTEKRVNDAREKGQVPRSKEFTTVIVLIAGAVAMMFVGNNMISSVAEVMEKSFSFTRKEIFDPVAITHHMIYSIETIAVDLGTFFGVTVLAALIAPATLGMWAARGVWGDRLDGRHLVRAVGAGEKHVAPGAHVDGVGRVPDIEAGGIAGQGQGRGVDGQVRHLRPRAVWAGLIHVGGSQVHDAPGVAKKRELVGDALDHTHVCDHASRGGV